MSVLRRGLTSCTRTISLRSGPPSTCIRFTTSTYHTGLYTDVYSIFAKRSISSTNQWRQRAAANAWIEDHSPETPTSSLQSDSQRNNPSQHGPITDFRELGERNLVNHALVSNLTDQMSLKTMTQVQSLTINETLKGTDVLAQARTGTGKTLAFLIPVLQNILKADPTLERPSGRGRSGSTASAADIRALVISPTRELAEQIAVEARRVTMRTGLIVQSAVGGTAKRFGLFKIRNEGCHLLVGTPGRLNDILSDPSSGVQAPKLSALVLDEADRLLDQGFAPEIEAIQKLLPDRREVDRQTLLFSATIPREVMQIVRQTMKPNFKYVRTVQEGELETHEKVPQKVVNVKNFANIMPALVELCKRKIDHMKDPPFKALIYFSSTAEVSMAKAVFDNLRETNSDTFSKYPLYPARILEIHSKLSQQQRTIAADNFRRSTCAIMLSSDVTARGMDFPNVTHVIQVGLPQTRETYIHRIGRTGRGDKQGEGWLFLTSLEMKEARHRLRDLPLTFDDSLETVKVDMTKDAQLPESTAKILSQSINAAKEVPDDLKYTAYKATLAVNTWVPGFQRQELINSINDCTRYSWGMPQPPAITNNLVQRLGLHQLEGINIGAPPRSRESAFGMGPAAGGFRNNGGGYGNSRGGFNRGFGDRSDSGSGNRDGYGGRGRTGYGRSDYSPRGYGASDNYDRRPGGYDTRRYR